MPRYKVIVECSGPHGNAALTYRINAASQFAAEFRACQLAGDHYPEYRGHQAGEDGGAEKWMK